jgi:hypothetical protein
MTERDARASSKHRDKRFMCVHDCPPRFCVSCTARLSLNGANFCFLKMRGVLFRNRPRRGVLLENAE